VNWKDECERCYLKIEGRLTPYIPKNSVTEDGTNDEEQL
uniref:Uncharacterized protein n=1 Tax=Panagrolaimus sp. PS1159 TaxID=55785 RepID=A0AC35GRK2_9BILA